MDARQNGWIASLGGPLVMLPVASLHTWRGGGGGCDVSLGCPALGTEQGGTDYDWACAVKDLIAVRQIYGREAVVLNDQDLLTTWRQVSGGEAVIARAWTEEPEDVLSAMVAGLTDRDRSRLLDPDDVIDHLARDMAPDGATTDAELAAAFKAWARGPSARLRATLGGGEYRVFDSVDEGTDVRESLTGHLDPGPYEIVSGWHRVDAEHTFVLHWMRRLAQA